VQFWYNLQILGYRIYSIDLLGCAHYEDNTPGFRREPYLFKDLVRNDPLYFMKKYRCPTTESQHLQLTDQQLRETPDRDDGTIVIVP
jgi:hypothetical protein